jgi:arabinogalactan endo-1,4-beta-galactosidase
MCLINILDINKKTIEMIKNRSNLHKISLFTISLFFTSAILAQSIEIVSYGENPLVVNPLTGSDLTVNFKYTSETGSTGNHLFIGLEVLDANNNYVSYVNGVTLENQTAGTDETGSLSFFVGSSNQTSENLPTGHYYQVKAILFTSGGWTENAWAGYWNSPILILEIDSNQQFSTNTIAKGADISWMTEMEDQGYIWKDNDGNTKELLPLLKEYNLDAVRLRVWVNPENSDANGWCDIDDLVDKAELANALNMDILISIHYSDHWADPGQQTKPATWTSYTVAQLETAVTNHTTAILTALNAVGITPKWIQIGNETNDGMLWTTGKASSGGFTNYAKFVNAGLNVVKNYNSSIKTVLHLASGNNNPLFRWNIDGLINNGLNASNLDIVGMSLYPDENNWKNLVDNTYSNMLDIKSRYSKEVMMVEIGFSSSLKDVSHQFITYMIEKTRQAEGLGVFYWEPIGISPFTSYSKGAWDDDRSPSIAMDAFINRVTLSIDDLENTNDNLFKIFPNPSSEFISIEILNTTFASVEVYNMLGKVVKRIPNYKNMQTINISNLSEGVYIFKVNGKGFKFLKN